MEIYCTRPGCPRPQNFFADLDDRATLKTTQQKYCTACGMPLILVSRYIPSKLLGQGGFGAAFLARDRYTPAMRQCVVKQFQPSGDLNPQQLKIAQDLFEREAEVLEQLGSENDQIPNLFAFFQLSVPTQQLGKDDQFFYLVQEFIDGKDLEGELAEKGKFSEAEVLEVLREILKVLKFVHENGSIHRDIKPSNIMRHRNGRLYLLDFGAVKQVTKAGTGGGVAGRSTGIYSMGFAPPEQMSGSQVYPSTDLYALAVTLITLLTGKEAGELYDSYNNQWNWRNYAQVSDTLADVLDRMLLPTPNQRYGSAQEVIDALNYRPTPQPLPQPISPPQQPPTPPTNFPTTVQPPVASTTVPPSQPPSNQPVTVPPNSPTPSKRRSFSTLELLSGAAFTGFEGALLFIALGSLLPSPATGIGLWGMIMGGIIFAQFRRVIEKFDFVIIAVITLLPIVFFAALRNGAPIQTVIVLSVLAAAGAIAITALFRLVYLLLSRLL
ncbi:MAG: serine/threonine protein kinase [Microcoleus sp. SIO2G3]|nr:serine/threonine protein kinase [Microcoleus sp. SIO2G3]